MEGGAQDSVWGGEAWNFTLSEPRFPQICVCSPNQKLCRPHFGGFYGGFITQVQLIKSLAVGDCFNRKPFSLSQTWRQRGTGGSSPLTTLSVPLASTPPTPRVLIACSLCVSPSTPFMKGEFIWSLLGHCCR